VAGVVYFSDSEPRQDYEDLANNLLAFFYLTIPFSDAYMYKDRRRSPFLGILSLFTLGLIGAVAQYLTSERRAPNEDSHFSLKPFQAGKQQRSQTRHDAQRIGLIKRKSKSAFMAFHGDPKSVELLASQRKEKKKQKQLSKEHSLQEKDNQKKLKKEAKLRTREEIQEAKIAASHQLMTAIQLFNRWLRGRRNPVYGALYVALIYFIIEQRGWALVGYLALYLIVVLPFLITSDGHMSTIRTLDKETTQVFSAFTGGLVGMFTQYVTRDGSVPRQKSLSNPLTFFSSLIDKERRVAIKSMRAEKRARQKQNRKILKEIIDFFNGRPAEQINLTYADLNQLCDTNLFEDHNSAEWNSFWEGPLGKQTHGKEILFYLKVLKEEFKPVKVGVEWTAKDSLEHNDFEILKNNYHRVPLVAKRSLNEYEQKQREEELQRLRDENRKKRVNQAIQRDQLPELRIQELNLPIPRAAQNAWDFEHVCRDWLEAWGEKNATVTQQSADGGVDIVSDHCVAQAKFYSNGRVGRPELQQLAGAAIPYGDPHLLFFAYNGYTNEAIDYAERISMCLFDFNAQTLRFDHQNSHAIELVKQLAKLHIS
jgi:restriction endonuclease Mrr